MKKKTERDNGQKINFVIGLNVALLMLMGWILYMQFSQDQRLAYVNSTYIMTNYEGFKEASQAYKLKSNVWQTNIDTLRLELEKSMQQYETEKSAMTSKEQALTEELLTTKRNQLVQYQQGIQQKAQQEDQAMTKAVIDEINAYLKDYGESNGYTFIFGASDMGNLVYAEEALDLTETVLEALNKNYRGE